jgi:hypothetical protein
MLSSICLKVRKLGLLAQDVLLKVTCSALTLMPGKKLRVTGPEICSSLPVASLIEELRSLVICVGLIKDAAYHAPTPAIVKQAIKAMREILRVLFTKPF